MVHKYRVPIPLGQVAFSAQEAFNVARSFGTSYDKQFVIKAQVKCEGRTTGQFKENGFQGAIHTVDDFSQVKVISDKMLGKKYVSQATGVQGFVVHCVYI